MNPETESPLPADRPAPSLMPPWQPVPANPPNPQRVVQVGLTVLALVVLAIAFAVAFMALLDIVRIWFEYQWVPVARAVLAFLVAGLALYVLRLLLKGKLSKLA